MTGVQIYVEKAVLTYVPEPQATRSSGGIFETVQRALQSDSRSFDTEKQVARIYDMPSLNTQESTSIGEDYLMRIRKKLIQNGASEGLDVIVTFKGNDFTIVSDRASFGIEDEAYSDSSYHFRIAHVCQKKPANRNGNSEGHVFLHIVKQTSRLD